MDECPVCLTDLHETNCCSLPCGHKFHVTCIISATQYDLRCPMCRNDIPGICNKKEENLPNIISLEHLYQNYRRRRNNYLNRKRRLLKNNDFLNNINKELNVKQKEMKQSEKCINKLWNEKMKQIWNEDTELLLLRKKYASQRRKCNLLETRINNSLENTIGTFPEFEDGLEQWIETF